MTLIVSKYSMVLDGEYIHYTRMTAEQETMWRAELDRIESQKAPATRKASKTGKKRGNGGGSGSSSRTFSASSVLARCLLAQVDRANRKDEIPFDGSLPASPAEITGRDYYGV